MINISYTISPTLKVSLDKIEILRQRILLTPLSVRSEIRFRWEATINHIYWSLIMSENPLSKKDVMTLLTLAQKKKLKPEEVEIIKYKKACDYIAQEWLVSSRSVSPKIILQLHDLACPGRFEGTETELKQELDYLQASSENPIVIAAISYIIIAKTRPFTDGNGRLSRLLSRLFLYKYGYDFKGFLVIEEYFRRDMAAFKFHFENALKESNVTPWLEYYAQSVAIQLEKAAQDIYSQRFHLDVDSRLFDLNDRQKVILGQMEQPEMSVTNKKVQKQFKISQITASRDLAKLASLGLLFIHGKGRSVYYTRI